MPAEPVIQISGPWTHRSVTANGTRFHVASMGDGPLVLLVHGFPEFWWTWRHQLVALADAGYRAVAVDLRGYGGSDKPPRGYDLMTAAADIAGLIRALGEANAVVVGHDWGGLTAWTLAAYFPKAVRRLAVVSMAHPLRMRAAVLSSPLSVPKALTTRPASPGGAATHWPSRCRCSPSGSWSATAGRWWGRSFFLVRPRLARSGDRAGLPAGHAHPAGGPHVA